MTEQEIETLQSSICDILTELGDRALVLYEVRKECKKASESFTGRNIDGIKANVLKNKSEIELTKLHKVLVELFSEHTSFDDKMITIYPEQDNIKKIEKALETSFLAVPKDKAKYACMKKTALSGKRTLYQFSTGRKVKVRKNLTSAEIKKAFKKGMFEEYEQIIAVVSKYLKCYDFLILDNTNNRIIIGVDQASILGHLQAMSSKSQLLQFLKKDLRISLDKDTAIDFFPKIRTFYKLPEDGTNGVIQITFETPSGTTHEEGARKSCTDLRSATYHKEGAKGVRQEKDKDQKIPLNNDITPYKITSKFYRNNRNHLEISLKSSYINITSSNNKHLFDAFIKESRNENDLDFAIDKLIS